MVYDKKASKNHTYFIGLRVPTNILCVLIAKIEKKLLCEILFINDIKIFSLIKEFGGVEQ